MVKPVARYNRSLLTLAVALPLLAVLMLSTPAQAQPVITLTPTSGAVGTEITISGTKFESWAGNSVSISFDDTEIPNSPKTVSETGTFTAVFTIPSDTTSGRHWITVTSEIGTATLEVKNFFIVEGAGIEIDVADGPVGTGVTISGKGFHAGRTVTLNYYNIIGEQLGTQVASPTGEFTYNFTVPNSTAGEHKITATDTEGNSAEAFFEVFPSIALNLASAGPGELLAIRGSGFGYKIEVDIYFGTYQVAKARTDESGDFEVKFNIPQVKPNPYDVKAEDDDGNIDKVKFITTAGASLSQSTGSIGTKLTVRGSGFTMGGTVTIDYDNLRVATVTTDNDGAFTTSFAVPVSSSGEHVITVSDGETTKQFAFTVESEAPPVPRLLLPSDGSETKAQAYLDWHDVTDLSLPVTYSLQIASDQNFSSLVLEKKDLTDSEYTLSEEERLVAVTKLAPYYWRVKATDSANNGSEWSDPWSFYVSAPPAPTLKLPASDSKASMPLFFNWQGTTSLSPPVTYSLQVATDLNFTSIVLEEKGLTDSVYTLTEEEELPVVKQEAPYYWRVKATDSANNESEWSDPSSFYTGSSFTLPAWVIYTLIVIVIIAVGYIAFRVGRRTAFKPPD